MTTARAHRNHSRVEDLYDQIINSNIARTLRKELLIVARRGNRAARQRIKELMEYLERHPDVREWLKSGAIVGILMEMVPLSRLGILVVPGYLPGAVAGYMKGSRTDSRLQSTIIGGAMSTALKPVVVLSPIVGMLLVAFAAGTLEEMLAGAASEAGPLTATGTIQ